MEYYMCDRCGKQSADRKKMKNWISFGVDFFIPNQPTRALGKVLVIMSEVVRSAENRKIDLCKGCRDSLMENLDQWWANTEEKV